MDLEVPYLGLCGRPFCKWLSHLPSFCMGSRALTFRLLLCVTSPYLQYYHPMPNMRTLLKIYTRLSEPEQGSLPCSFYIASRKEVSIQYQMRNVWQRGREYFNHGDPSYTKVHILKLSLQKQQILNKEHIYLKKQLTEDVYKVCICLHKNV